MASIATVRSCRSRRTCSITGRWLRQRCVGDGLGVVGVGLELGRPRLVVAWVGWLVGTLVLDGVTVELPGPPEVEVVVEGVGTSVDEPGVGAIEAPPVVVTGVIVAAPAEVVAEGAAAAVDGAEDVVGAALFDTRGFDAFFAAPPRSDELPGRSLKVGVESRAVDGASTSTAVVATPMAPATRTMRVPWRAPTRAHARVRSVRRRLLSRSGRSARIAATLLNGAER